MSYEAPPGELVMHWAPVVDDRGRSHMQAHWTVAPQAPATVATVTHAA